MCDDGIAASASHERLSLKDRLRTGLRLEAHSKRAFSLIKVKPQVTSSIRSASHHHTTSQLLEFPDYDNNLFPRPSVAVELASCRTLLACAHHATADLEVKFVIVAAT